MSKPSRNDPCPCGSGKKYKKCCYKKDVSSIKTATVMTGDAGSSKIVKLMQAKMAEHYGNLENWTIPKFGPGISQPEEEATEELSEKKTPETKNELEQK